MKKVGILTQPLIANYGGILQNYALQEVLKKENISVETINRIDYVPDYKVGLLKVKQFMLRHHNNKLLFNYQKQKMVRECQKFVLKYINKVDVINPTDEKLIKVVRDNMYTSIVVGSDQVWRPKYSINIYHDYLNFVDDNQLKKVAYAASFGTSTWEYTKEQEERCKKLVKKFNAVSVREKDGVELCEKYFDISAMHVLDPTMLLTKEDYVKIINDSSIEKRKGVFNYVLDADFKKTNLINNIASFLGTSIYQNHPKYSLTNSSNVLFSLENFGYPSIEGWLASFRDADFIVTDSFHGTVFSILFNKPFVSIINKNRGSARFESLLELLGLSYRLISDVDKFSYELLNDDINYELINIKLSKLRELSINFLMKNI